jgi:diacylglycerol kinase
MSRFLKSFRFAFKGIAVAFKEQLNLKIHAVATLLVFGLGFYFKITTTEWLVLLLTTSLVIGLELINTAIEYMVDLVSPEQNPLAGKIKDFCAGAVLVGAIGALVIGIVIFSKYIFS